MPQFHSFKIRTAIIQWDIFNKRLFTLLYSIYSEYKAKDARKMVLLIYLLFQVATKNTLGTSPPSDPVSFMTPTGGNIFLFLSEKRETILNFNQSFVKLTIILT